MGLHPLFAGILNQHLGVNEGGGEMAELKATKGPYKVVHSLNIVSGDGRRGIANCGGYSSNKDGTLEENIANARLLAASWKLYHVLDYALAALKHCFHAHDSGVDGICLEIEAVMAEVRGDAT